MASESSEENWWNSVHNMTGLPPETKYSDGCESLFTAIDTDNLEQAIRPEGDEPVAGQPGFAPQGKIGG